MIIMRASRNSFCIWPLYGNNQHLVEFIFSIIFEWHSNCTISYFSLSKSNILFDLFTVENKSKTIQSSKTNTASFEMIVIRLPMGLLGKSGYRRARCASDYLFLPLSPIMEFRNLLLYEQILFILCEVYFTPNIFLSKQSIFHVTFM